MALINERLQARAATIRREEVRYTERWTDDAQLLVVAFGSAGRIAQTAVQTAREQGLPVGLFRPVSLWPFPTVRLAQLARRVPQFLVVELNAGQMLEDVRLAVGDKTEVHFLGRMGGLVPMPEEILAAIQTAAVQGGVAPQGMP